MEGVSEKQEILQGKSNSYFRTILRVTKHTQTSHRRRTEFLKRRAARGVIIWYGGLQVLGKKAWRGSEFLRVFSLRMFQASCPPNPRKLSKRETTGSRESLGGGESGVFEVLDYRAETIKDAPGAVDLPAFSSDIRFRGGLLPLR